MSKQKRLMKKFLNAISFNPAKLSNNKGRFIPTTSSVTRKDRKHDGHRIICFDDNDYPIQFDTYDDWKTYRDGQRDKRNMHKNIYVQMSWYNDELYYSLLDNNYKIKKHEKIRKAMKNRFKIPPFK